MITDTIVGLLILLLIGAVLFTAAAVVVFLGEVVVHQGWVAVIWVVGVALVLRVAREVGRGASEHHGRYPPGPKIPPGPRP